MRSSTVQYVFLWVPYAVAGIAPRSVLHRRIVLANSTATPSSAMNTTSTTTTTTTTSPTTLPAVGGEPVVNAVVTTAPTSFTDRTTIDRTGPLSWAPVGNSSTIVAPSCSGNPAEGWTSGWCEISVGTVHIEYFPTSSMTSGLVVPSVSVLPEYGLTMYAPSVYYILNTIIATDWCGNPVGTTITDLVTSYDLIDVSTLSPYACTTCDYRVNHATAPAQLTLNDLTTCYQQPDSKLNYEELIHVVMNQYYNGCYPILVWPERLLEGVQNLWANCKEPSDGALGLFDPPSPVSACAAADSACLFAGVTTATSAPVPAKAELPTTTQAAQPVPTVTTLPTSTAVKAATTNVGVVAQDPPSNKPAGPGLPVLATDPSTNQVTNPSSIQAPTNPSSIQAPNPSSVQAPNPSIRPSIVANVGPSVVSVDPAASSVVIDHQTASVGGPPITVSNSQVVSLGTEGVVVSNPTAGSIATTYRPQGVAADVTAPGTVVDIGGQGVKITPTTVTGSNGQVNDAVANPGQVPGPGNASPIVSAAVVGSNTLTIGGPAATMTGGEVVSLGSAGVVIASPGGGVTTVPVKNVALASLMAGQTVTTAVGGQMITAVAVGSNTATGKDGGQGAATAVVDGQTISVGGPSITLPGAQIASLGSAGLVIQMPGGGQTTIPVYAMAGTTNATTTGTSSSTSPQQTSSPTPNLTLPNGSSSGAGPTDSTSSIIANLKKGSAPSSSLQPGSYSSFWLCGTLLLYWMILA